MLSELPTITSRSASEVFSMSLGVRWNVCTSVLRGMMLTTDTRSPPTWVTRSPTIVVDVTTEGVGVDVATEAVGVVARPASSSPPQAMANRAIATIAAVPSRVITTALQAVLMEK